MDNPPVAAGTGYLHLNLSKKLKTENIFLIWVMGYYLGLLKKML